MYMHLQHPGTPTVQCTCISSFQVHLLFSVHASPASRYILSDLLYTEQCTCIPSFQVHLLYNVHATPASRYTYRTMYMHLQLSGTPYTFCSAYMNSQLPGTPTIHCTLIPSFQVHYCTLYIPPQIPGIL